MNPHTGSNFDSFLEEEGILEEVSVRARKRLLAMQLGDLMEEAEMSKARLAEKLHASSDQVDQLLDPDNTSITLDTLERVARALGKRLRVEFA
ncbi:MAG TPA: helix-turn-helix transcriptional regulator [Thermoanaerobaculia bacterium]|jgi:predicted XRE-type DNA-binding protein